MDGGGTDAAGDHALAELGEARRGVDLGAVLASVRVDIAGPEDLAEGAAAGPEDAVDDDFVNRLGPGSHLASDDELRFLLSQPFARVVAVDQPPPLRRRAPIVKWVVLCERSAVVKVKPVAAATVEVLFDNH